MIIEPEHITERMAAMLRKVGRADLVATGFELDDATFDRSRALSPRDLDHAIVHALFDRSAAPEPVAPQVATPATHDAAKRIDRVAFQVEASAYQARATGVRAEYQRWAQIALLIVIALTLLAATARAQPATPLIVGAKASGATVPGSLRKSGIWYLDCGASTTFSATTSTVTCPGTGASPSIPSTTNVIKGDGSGGLLTAVPGTDYVTPASSALSGATFFTLYGYFGANVWQTGFPSFEQVTIPFSATYTHLGFYIATPSGTSCTGGTCGLTAQVWSVNSTGTAPVAKLCTLTNVVSGGSPNLNATGWTDASWASPCVLPAGVYDIMAYSDSSALAIPMAIGIGGWNPRAVGYCGNAPSGNGASLALNATCGTQTGGYLNYLFQYALEP